MGCVAVSVELESPLVWGKMQGWKRQPWSARYSLPILPCQQSQGTGALVEGKAARGAGRSCLTPFSPPQNMLRCQQEMENGMAWSISSESSDDSSSPAAPTMLSISPLCSQS